jgi:hypothetical protein
MDKPFHDNPEKGVVREHWDAPLLQYLHDRHRVRYRYLGLPGVDLIDVRLWSHMIDDVIAFEPPGPPPNPRKAIDLLRKNMRIRGVNGVAYWGSFEEVVMLRKDFDGQPYNQGKIVTLYNLDFCNEITSKVETQNAGRKAWRFEAIRQILRDQSVCFDRDGAPRHFFMMLTIRNQTSPSRIRPLLMGPSFLAEAKSHHDGCALKNPLPKEKNALLIGSHSWALKTGIYNFLLSYFSNPCLSVLFFPPVLYNGTPVRDKADRNRLIPSPMLHLVVLCRFADPERVGVDCSPDQYLGRPSVAVNKAGLIEWSPQTGEANGGPKPPNPVEWLSTYGARVLLGL